MTTPYSGCVIPWVKSLFWGVGEGKILNYIERLYELSTIVRKTLPGLHRCSFAKNGGPVTFLLYD